MEKFENISEVLSKFIIAQLEGDEIEADLDDKMIVELVKIARKHQIVGFVGQSLVKLKAGDEGLCDMIRSECVQKIMFSNYQMNELKQVQDAFEKEKIKNMPMKGAFMKNYYNRPDLREMSDLDICVEEHELEHVKEVLENMGYTLIKRVSNHDVYWKEPCVMIEVHKCLYKQEIDKRQHEYFESFKNAVLDENKEYCYHQKLEDFYVYMIAHMAGHFYKRGCGVRNIIDLYVFEKKFKNQTDEEYITKELEECGLTTFEKHMKKLCDIWLKGQKREKFYDDLLWYMLDCGIYGKSEYGIWQGYAKTGKDAGKDKKQMKKWYYFPPCAYMKQYYGYLNKAPFLLPFAWIHRAVRSIVLGKQGKMGMERMEYMKEVSQEEIDIISNIYREMDFKFE